MSACTLTKKITTLDSEIVSPEITVKLEIWDVLKNTMHKPNIYTIWNIECNSIFDEIGMTKYPWKCFQWYCLLPEGHINWNKGQISITLVPLKTFLWRFKWDILVSNDNTRNEFKYMWYVYSVPVH